MNRMQDVFDLAIGKTIRNVKVVEASFNTPDTFQLEFDDGTFLQVETSEWVSEVRYLQRLNELEKEDV